MSVDIEEARRIATFLEEERPLSRKFHKEISESLRALANEVECLRNGMQTTAEEGAEVVGCLRAERDQACAEVERLRAELAAAKAPRSLPAYAEITPEQAEAYLRAKGWECVDSGNWHTSLWDHETTDRSAHCPTHRAWAARAERFDYGDMIERLCDVLGQHEDRCGCEVARDMLAIEVPR